MKIIFLDIDGVLNYSGCKARSPSGCIGIEHDKLQLLKQIVDATGAKIVLTSTWKTEWFPTNHIEDLSADARYLIKQLSNVRLGILDKTIDTAWAKRGEGILNYLKDCYCEAYVILDDERFDFFELGLDKNFVKTNFFNGGLNTVSVERAIKILGGKLDDC